jgi:hypothetical protein
VKKLVVKKTVNNARTGCASVSKNTNTQNNNFTSLTQKYNTEKKMYKKHKTIKLIFIYISAKRMFFSVL